ncbi:MAG: GNAT family protein [Bifidobacteriaceae bacterium]|nr:GNAT family protein [Bifidobacteriaceae bacterium]
MSTSADEAEADEIDASERTLPAVITIPDIRGEMCLLRPATWADCQRMDDIHAFDDAETITGKSSQAERAVVRAWVSRSVAWSGAGKPAVAGSAAMPDWSDPESRGVMAWAMYTDAPRNDAHEGAGGEKAPEASLIGMIFLVDIDGWNRSARLQVVLGVDYRGRGYSRDAMPRVMTYAFARRPVGLGLERIWLSLPDANTRNSSVYESLGFELSGRSRNAMWDSRDGEYHDVLIYDEIVEEYDPIRSLAAFGLHNIIENPGVKEALAARNAADAADSTDDGNDGNGMSSDGNARNAADTLNSTHVHREGVAPAVESAVSGSNARAAHADAADSTGASEPKKSADDALDDALSELSGEYDGSTSVHTDWAYSDDARQPDKKRAWWRNLGRNRNRKGDES